MDLYFGGAEISSHRSLLAKEGVEHVSMSYIGLRRTTKFVRPWVIADRFPEEQKVFLDSGAYTVNKAPDDERYTQAALKDIASHYMAFVQENVDRLTMVTEFDALPLGREWIEGVREDFWDSIPDDKFLPVWHDEFGLDELDRLAQRYSRVAVFSTESGGRDITHTLNGLVQKYGTLLHGVNMSKGADMKAVKWATISTISWLSPSQYGDTIIWTGKELKRYPKKYKDQARRRHRTYLDDHGFNSELIEADDKNEVLRLSLWSWQQAASNGHGPDRANVVSIFGFSDTPEIRQEAGAEVDTQGAETVNSVPTRKVHRQREVVPIPLLSTTGLVDAEDATEKREPLLMVRSDSMRVCEGCFLAKNCPAYEPGSTCAYNIPVEVKSKEQINAVQNALIEIQTQRVLFMKMAEDLEGGAADPNLSNEMDRLQKMIAKKHEMDQDQWSLKIEAKGAAQAGVISRLFGREAGDQMRALPAPVQVEQIAEAMDVEFIEHEDGS